MPAIKLEKFGGELPAWDPKLLPDGQSQQSINGYMFSGRLEGWRQPTFLRNLTFSTSKFAYRIPTTTFDNNGNAIFSSAIGGSATWLEYNDPDTTVVRSQVVNDGFQRYYVAGPTLGPPTYNTLSRIQSAGRGFFQLGIPAPTTAPLITVNGGGSIATIGPTTATGGSTTVNANVIYLLPIVPSGASLINSISFMPNATNPNVKLQGVVYADNGVGGNAATVPGALLGNTGVSTGITASNLVTLSFVNPVAVNASQPYWIGITMDTAETIFAGDGVNASVQFLNSFSNGPPSVAPAVQKGLPDLQMYANVTTGGVLETRSYVYTYISAYGEEGPPSPPTVLTGFSNASWTCTPTFPAANYLGGGGLGNLAILRIYRTVTSSQGTATYFQVADIAVGSTDADAVLAVANDALGCQPYTPKFIDGIPDSTVALNLVLASTNYFPPPANLQQIVAMPNGMYAGWVGNSVYFCQPYLPHAWPPGYVYTVDAPIVGMAVTGGALVVVTVGAPWTFIGTNPSSMSQIKGSHVEPCNERGSIIGTDLGVFYKSINGLIQVANNGQMSNDTETWITRDKWNTETPATGTRAVPYYGSYFAFAAGSQQGFTIELDVDSASFTIWPQPGGHRIGFNQLKGPNGLSVTNMMLDPWTGLNLLIQNGAIYYYDFTNPTPTMQTYDWTSKVYQQNTKRSYEAFKVWFTNPSGLPPPGMRNTALPTDPSWQSLPAGAWLYVLIYADVEDGTGDGTMQLICAREVQRSGELLRLPSGFKADNWMVRFIGRVPVTNMQLATSAKELANV